MGNEVASLKTKKIRQSLNPTGLDQREKMKKEAGNRKTKKIHQSLNPMTLNQRQ